MPQSSQPSLPLGFMRVSHPSSRTTLLQRLTPGRPTQCSRREEPRAGNPLGSPPSPHCLGTVWCREGTWEKPGGTGTHQPQVPSIAPWRPARHQCWPDPPTGVRSRDWTPWPASFLCMTWVNTATCHHGEARRRRPDCQKGMSKRSRGKRGKTEAAAAPPRPLLRVAARRQGPGLPRRAAISNLVLLN